MKVISTNIANPTTVSWRGKEIKTGIFKNPVSHPLFLGKEDVANDTVIDRKHHGGEYKACYLFSSDYYEDWKIKYPQLNWQWGMFGENLTVEGLDENEIRIGNIYKIGSATVQVTEPRQPCFKLGIRFETQEVLKKFIDYGHPGTYVRILQEGEVAINDELELLEENQNAITVQEYNLIVNRMTNDSNLIQKAIENESIRADKREKLKKLI
ncbi:MOSC domain-containing protein [Croceivirga thetidis]|uniref:MOSC domain-containing protein n=1 Tax=Croceivirga thetidis TaxID=2721623 RepID=A0ABX1GU22_9FLAO|nr:MOSC domain-containing protein [Croceivirga thetidis]NKI33457.1 MOSC domain-containing protein [Croceivirga thetidis]